MIAVRRRTDIPAGDGEVLLDPPFEVWSELAARNARTAAGWDVPIAGVPLARLRQEARREALAHAAAYSRVLGIPIMETTEVPSSIVMTGHQPELFHPGVWAKHFLVQRTCEETGAVGIDVVVDSDTFDVVEAHVPMLLPEMGRRRLVLVRGDGRHTYAAADRPSADELRTFREEGLAAVRTLPAPAVERHFETYCAELEGACTDASKLADVLTIARRRYERPSSTTYLELPVTHQAGGAAFLHLVAHVACDAERFAHVHRSCLAGYRQHAGIRSAAQPFPDLEVRADRVELPFWLLEGGRRERVWVQRDSRTLVAGGDLILELDEDPAACARALSHARLPIVPRALTLTMFERLFVADLFIHGVGGARYDRVTDEVIRAYLGIEPPPYVTASLTLRLPFGGHIVSDDEIARAARVLRRFDHNPDAFLDAAGFDTPEERLRADELARAKRTLVAAMATASPSEKRRLAEGIEELNAALSRLLAPLRVTLEDDLARLEALRSHRDVLTDRTYPFFLWDPREVADKVGCVCT